MASKEAMEARVLCVPTEWVTPGVLTAGPHGLRQPWPIEAETWIRRADAEVNPAWRQVIPYVIVHRADGRVLAANRTSQAGEQRLHGQMLIGWGGHIEEVDGGLEGGLEREMAEELLVIPNMGNLPRPIATVAHSRSAVGRVHVGVVYTWLVIDAHVREEHKYGSPQWLTLDEIAERDDLEEWARMIVDSQILMVVCRGVDTWAAVLTEVEHG